MLLNLSIKFLFSFINMEEKVKQYDILSNKLDENNIYNELIYI